METGRQVRSKDAWAAARDAYLGGLAAADVCERFGLGLSTLRARARREGWRRSDRPDPDPDLDLGLTESPDEEFEALETDPPGPAELAEQAWARAGRAVVRGRLREAQGWTRLWRELLAAADALAGASGRRLRRPPRRHRRCRPPHPHHHGHRSALSGRSGP